MNKDKTIPKLWDNKVDKGGYTGTAQNLKSEIDSKVSKSGDTITGSLTLKSDNDAVFIRTNIDRRVLMFRGDEEKGSLCCFTDGVGISNKKSGKAFILYEDGTVSLPANNLKTQSKEVVAAINEIYGDGFIYRGVIEDDNITISDIIELKPGVYTTNAANIEGIKVRGWYTIKKFRHKNLDQNVIVENSGSPDNYYMGAFNNTSFTGWASYSSDSKYAPYAIGDVYTTTRSENPASIWLGTTWIKLGDQNIGGTTVYCWKRNS